jgi:hypothetical protein
MVMQDRVPAQDQDAGVDGGEDAQQQQDGAIGELAKIPSVIRPAEIAVVKTIATTGSATRSADRLSQAGHSPPPSHRGGGGHDQGAVGEGEQPIAEKTLSTSPQRPELDNLEQGAVGGG